MYLLEEAEERYARLEGITPVLQLLTGVHSHSFLVLLHNGAFCNGCIAKRYLLIDVASFSFIRLPYQYYFRKWQIIIR
jgi:hypothetical protein